MNLAKRMARAKIKAQHMRYGRHYGENSESIQPSVRIANKDRGCPFHGKDQFSGMWRKFKMRVHKEQIKDGSIVTFVGSYCNNKY